MKYVLLIIALLIASCTGPTGPAGKQGVAGEKGEQGIKGNNGTNGIDGVDGNNNVWFYDSTGTLGSPTISTSGGNDYWYIVLPSPMYDDSILVQVWVRIDDNYLWAEPISWYYESFGCVKIIKQSSDIICQTGSQFKINVIYYY